MAATDRLQNLVGKRLRVDADTRDTVSFCNREFLFRDCIRSAALKRKFHETRHVDKRIDLSEKRVKLFGGKHRRGTAADIHRRDCLPEIANDPHHILEILVQLHKIVVDERKQFA